MHSLYMHTCIEETSASTQCHPTETRAMNMKTQRRLGRPQRDMHVYFHTYIGYVAVFRSVYITIQYAWHMRELMHYSFQRACAP